MPSLQSHDTQKNSSIHTSVLIYVQYIVQVLVQLSVLCVILVVYFACTCQLRLTFPAYSILLFFLVCVCVCLSPTTQSRLLSTTIERPSGCGAGEPGYLAAFPASLCPGQWPPCCCYCQLVVQVNNGPGLGGCISY